MEKNTSTTNHKSVELCKQYNIKYGFHYSWFELL